MRRLLALHFVFLVATLPAAEASKTLAPAPVADRVGFPTRYADTFQILRTVNKAKDLKVVTVYGNERAASVTNIAQLPYPFGSIIVMETASAITNAEGKPLLDERGNLRKSNVSGLHVMRREKNFGEAYAMNRTAEWEYVEYRPDGSHLTAPKASATCAACHVKAGAQRDFVYHGRFSTESAK